MRAIHWAAGAAAAALICGAGGPSRAGDIAEAPDSPTVGIGMICGKK